MADNDEKLEGAQDAKPSEDAKAPEAADKNAEASAKKPVSVEAPKAKPTPRAFALPAVITIAVVAVVVGLVIGRFALGASSSISLDGTTSLASDKLDTVIATYTYDGKTTDITARQVIEQNGSADSQADSDGNYTVPAATDIVSYARNQIVLSAADAQGLTASDDEVDAYANQMFGTTDYSQIASQYNIDEDTAKATIQQSAVMSKLRDSVVTTTVPEQPTAPTKPSDDAEDTPTAEYAQYIISLAGDEWDADNNTWASTDGDYYNALSTYDISNDSATYAAAQAAYYVAYSAYSTASSQVSSEWTAYCNTLLSKATIQIGSLAV